MEPTSTTSFGDPIDPGKEEENPNIFEELPIESIAHIFSFLPAPHLCELSSASKQLCDVADLDVVWRPALERDFGVHSRKQRQDAQDLFLKVSSDPIFVASQQLKDPEDTIDDDADFVSWKDLYKYYYCWPMAADVIQVKRKALMMYHRSWVRDIIPSPIPAEYSDQVSHGESERFLTCSDDLSIMEVDLSNGTIAVNKAYPNSHENHILSMELNPFADHSDPKSIVMASAGSDCNVKLWTLDMQERKLVPCAVLKGHDRLVRCVRFPSPDTLISCAHDSTVRVWDIPGGTLRAVLTCSENQVDVMDFDMITPTILTCSCSDGSLKFFDIETEKMIYVLQDAHTDAVRRVRVLRLPDDHPTGWDAIRTLGATTNHPKTFDEWIALRQKVEQNRKDEEHEEEEDNPNVDIPGLSLRTRWNTLIVTCSYDRSLRVWSLATLKELMFTLTGISNELGQFSALEVYPIVGLHQNNAVLVTGSYDHRVRFWDLNTGNVVRTLAGHAGIPCIAKMWRDRVISVGTDGTVNEWRPRPMSEKTTSTLFFHARDSRETLLKEITAPDVLDQLMRLQDRLSHLAHLAQNAMRNQQIAQLLPAQDAEEEDEIHNLANDEEDEDEDLDDDDDNVDQ